ncbi:DNA polymerase I, thermostable [Zea mays]|uniref:DNA polymerase I, thermostable n=1 Tax=Zea mays TaxID=4577 RepID=A0A3L6DT15_MAIZE|nr:DNA polymerase I, thermostable [Zea mays]
MLPMPTAGAVAAAGVAAPLGSRPVRLVVTRATTTPSFPTTSTSAISTASPAGHSRKDLSGRDDALSKPTKPRVFFLDVNPLCFRGSQRSLGAFARWLALFFAHVSLRDPVVVVVRVDGYEADDVVATLTEQVLQKGYRVFKASPDKDFKQLMSDDVQLAVMPIPEVGRWSFYTLRQVLHAFMGDEADGVPGIQRLVPGFGRKTALKLLQKHGSLENLLNTATIRIVGKGYAQDALTKHAYYLRINYEVVSLKRDVNIQFDDSWLSRRNTSNDTDVLADFILKLNGEGRS